MLISIFTAWGPLGVILIILATFLAMFPKKLPRAAQRMAAIANTENIQTSTRSFSGKWLNKRKLSEVNMRAVSRGHLLLNFLPSLPLSQHSGDKPLVFYSCF